MLLSKDYFVRAVRNSDIAQDSDAPLPASLQQLVDELVGNANRTRIIISGRRGGRPAVMAEIAKQMALKADKSASKNESGGATVPCPWGEGDSCETFYPAAKVEPTAYGVDNHTISGEAFDELLKFLKKENGLGCLKAAKKEKEPEKPPIGLKSRFIVDKQRIAEILDAMGRYNSADKAIPEEWMDELSDLLWRERDRLGANTED